MRSFPSGTIIASEMAVQRLCLWCCVVIATVLAGCTARSVPVSAVPAPVNPAANASADERGFLDLQPGWRLHVITPILKSGGFVVHISKEQVRGNTIDLSSDADFVGYETSYYAVTARRGGGVSVQFSSAEVTKQGQAIGEAKPIAPLFRLPRSARYIRLIFLVRVSQADHDMAVAAANRTAALDELTKRIQTDPDHACKNGDGFACAWIPDGIAVRPEVPKVVEGATQWIPAR